ncbi:hypothetical protein [Apibacter adventoris]|uniref:hypothetical protein n=1 Tax=Apibacter adventoris TaxID=1679466 RepID=UPI000CF65ED4|nr:hypothetical protein [Apibacter adventoris]PQL95931.1 hypothetical protein C4S76_00065 [Apibacter adventoris]
MKIQLFILVYVLTLSLVFCQGQEKVNIEKVLSNQLENGVGQFIESAGVELPKEEFTNEELDISTYLGEKILDSNGYKIISNKEFYNKVETIFKRKLDSTSQNKYVYVNLNDICNKTFLKYPNWEFQGFYIIKGRNFISRFYFVPEIIDYQKEYPKVAEIENTMSLTKKYDDDNISIERWKDFEDLAQNRRFNQQLLISRNKYLFNDDKSQFAWLINNDEDFMQSLVTTFGYTEDKKLLKWAFEKQGFKYQKYPPDEILENYGNFLWTKQCNGEIKLHPNTLNLIKELVKPSSKYGNEEYILYLAEYINYLVNNEKETELNLQQKAKIAAYLLAFGEQYKYNKEYGYNQMFLGKFIFYQDPDKKYKKEFEKNNYYNLPNLKKWYQQAEQEKDMFENDQTLADDPQPKDYVYRATYYKGPYSK